MRLCCRFRDERRRKERERERGERGRERKQEREREKWQRPGEGVRERGVLLLSFGGLSCFLVL